MRVDNRLFIVGIEYTSVVPIGKTKVNYLFKSFVLYRVGHISLVPEIYSQSKVTTKNGSSWNKAQENRQCQMKRGVKTLNKRLETLM